MGRRRVYANAAERQRAYRQRHTVTQGVIPAPSKIEPRRRPPSRPARLQVLVDGSQALLDELQDWLDRLPEAFEGTALSERLREAVERLGIAVEALDGLELPRGFGRD